MTGTQIVKRVSPYLVTIGLFGGLIGFVLDKGSYLAMRQSATRLIGSPAASAVAGRDHPFGLLLLQERNLTGTAVGTLVIACAAADDITAWCILAFVVAVAKASSFRSCIITIGLVVLFISAMLYLVRPWVSRRC